MTSASQLEIRPPTQEDIPGLKPILERWIFDRHTGKVLDGEVEATERAIEASIAGANNEEFLVASQDGQLLGIMGIQTPNEKMLEYAETDKPAELFCALVSDEARGRGVGRALVDALTERAHEQGAKELIVNSGPRYRPTGWPFWQKMFGKPIGVAVGYYGKGGDAMVWRKALDEK
jgi:GNAT superfamily N-acetyltransferase